MSSVPQAPSDARPTSNLEDAPSTDDTIERGSEPSTSNHVAASRSSRADKRRITIACIECRNRKLKCDGERPSCRRCARRKSACVYDPEPKRRGPDKTPGSRSRVLYLRSKARAASNLPTADDLLEDEDAGAPGGAGASTSSRQQKISVPHTNTNTSTQVTKSSTDIIFQAYPGPVRRSSSVSAVQASQPTASLKLQHVEPNTFDVPNHQTHMVSAISDHQFTFVPPFQGASRPHDDKNRSKPYLNFDPPSTGEVELPVIERSTQITPYPGRPKHPTKEVSPYEHELTSQSAAVSASNDYCYHIPASQTYPFAPDKLNYPNFLNHHTPSIYSTRPSVDIYTPSTISPRLIREPSLNFSQETWWDTLITIYGPNPLNATSSIFHDLDYVFRTSYILFSFFNLQLFYNTLHDPDARIFMQPSLVLALLAFSKLIRSSEADLGQGGRKSAYRLLDYAQGSFQASYNSNWIDTSLAQAAWVIVQFEFCSHPLYAVSRAESALHLLDNTIRYLNLTYIDADNPASSIFAPDTVPTIPRSQLRSSYISGSTSLYPQSALDWIYQSPKSSSSGSTPPPAPSPFIPGQTRCPCHSLSLSNTPEAVKKTPFWLSSLNWDPSWTSTEIRVEEGRRLVWHSLNLATGFSSAKMAAGFPPIDLFIMRPENYALLFPGEILYHSPPYCDWGFSGKESTWALWMRTMMIWNVCARVANGRSFSDEIKGDVAMKAWVETVAIEEALNEHDCDGEKGLMYQGREYIFNIRTLIMHEYKHTVPFPQTGFNFAQFNRNKTMQWLKHQNEVSLQILKTGMPFAARITGNILTKRPYYVWWFMGQSLRALQFWGRDPSLSIALDVSINMLAIVEYIVALWPCPLVSTRIKMLRAGLNKACAMIGRSPLPPPAPVRISQEPNIPP